MVTHSWQRLVQGSKATYQKDQNGLTTAKLLNRMVR